VDGDNFRSLGVLRIQSAKADGKNIWNKVRVREENIKLNK
jgi:hypothetical protein